MVHGAFFLLHAPAAGLSSGVYASTSELSHLWRADRRFVPTLGSGRAQELMANWEHAVRQTTAE